MIFVSALFNDASLGTYYNLLSIVGLDLGTYNSSFTSWRTSVTTHFRCSSSGFPVSYMGIDAKGDLLRRINHVGLFIAFNVYVIIQQLTLFTTIRDFGILGVLWNNLIHASNTITTWVLIYRNRKAFQHILEKVHTGIYERVPTKDAEIPTAM